MKSLTPMTTLLSVIAVLLIVVGLFIGVPYYNVWQQEMSGRAELAKAEQNRQIQIAQARANLEAEKLNAQAEVERAKGAAQAIKIENGSLTPNYIKYLWVRYQKDNTGKTIIYVPAGEMGIPVMEASRLQSSK
ncbi:MAG: hypothetical protein Q3994_03255 [Prevotella sp.]|nr:hypothetical protein [Prevotella sp.]